MPSVLADFRLHDSETARLLSLCGTLNNIEPVHQKLVAEIVLLRLFDLFENLVSSISTKLVCGATYGDGTAPILLARARSNQRARTLFQMHGRARPRHQLTWSKASEIKENVRYLIDQHDNFVNVVDRNGALIDELRRVRNRIAHNNASSRRNYREVVRRHYGAYMNHVTPGILLLTPRIQPILIEQYIKGQRIMARDLVRA
jgi:hypothetical protein